MKTYKVYLYEQPIRYHVEAETKEQAENIALTRYQGNSDEFYGLAKITSKIIKGGK